MIFYHQSLHQIKLCFCYFILGNITENQFWGFCLVVFWFFFGGGGGYNIMTFFRKVSILQGIDSLFNAYYGYRVIRITLNLKPLCCNCRYSY